MANFVGVFFDFFDLADGARGTYGSLDWWNSSLSHVVDHFYIDGPGLWGALGINFRLVVS